MRLFNEQIITRPYTYNIDFARTKPHTGCVIVEVNKQLQMLINTQVYLRTSEYYLTSFLETIINGLEPVSQKHFFLLLPPSECKGEDYLSGTNFDYPN